jgi:hypothetical protein
MKFQYLSFHMLINLSGKEWGNNPIKKVRQQGNIILLGAIVWKALLVLLSG